MRRLWKASPRATAIRRSPYQLISQSVASNPAHDRAVAKPASLALVWNTTQSRGGVPTERQNPHQPHAPDFPDPGLHRPASRAQRGTAPQDRRPGNRPRRRRPPPPGRPARLSASHTAFSAVSILAASTARRDGSPSANGKTSCSDNIARVLVWIQARRPRARRGQFGPRLHPPDQAVAVFHRKGEIPFLPQAAHARPFALRHLTLRNQPLGASADAAPQRADQHLARCANGQRRRAQLDLTGRHVPQRRCAQIARLRSHSASLISAGPQCD